MAIQTREVEFNKLTVLMQPNGFHNLANSKTWIALHVQRHLVQLRSTTTLYLLSLKAQMVNLFINAQRPAKTPQFLRLNYLSLMSLKLLISFGKDEVKKADVIIMFVIEG